MNMKSQAREITSEEFDRILIEIIRETDPITLLRVPAVYEAVAEYYNNEVLEKWEKEYS
jgi:transcriptional regulator NrdR family protein